ncbi:MAG TPA: glycosyltransferase family 4 protein [Pyrinomonadaceae bacterium]|jgi:glycosyltransferase involved in cell wall biosynthesis|nr:glycosyltransferase family 4 protein [Pyrinomonadaceae bacterium]
MKISIYNEPLGSGIGGSEFVAALLAEALAKNHQVNLFHRIPGLTAKKLGENSGTNLHAVKLHYVDLPGTQPQLSRHNPLSHYRQSQNFLSHLSESSDIFIAIMHGVPPFSHARKGALILLFPTPTAPYVKPEGGLDTQLALKYPAKYLYQSWVWKKRMETYQLKTAISDFSSQWARKRWGIDCKVVYPPVNTSFRTVAKDKIILSVGRFAVEGEGHTKKQEQMLDVYNRMNSEAPVDWKYYCVGGLGETPAHKDYFERLTTLAAASGAYVRANIARDELTSLYERASIFWHAAGYGEDQNIRPIFVEHFGISTVEAMAAGCVPVVIKKGGQAEIVEHGVSGFLWETLDELRDYTTRLINDDNLRTRMANAARKRAELFSRETFVKNFVGRLLGE